MRAIIIIFLFPLLCKCTVTICRSVTGETCCSGSFWNKTTSTCEKCPLGYYDINCSEICSFPSYGEDCQDTCVCVQSLCDYRYGCTVPKGKTSYDTVYLENATTFGVIEITSTLEESALSGKNISDLPNFLLYLIIASVVTFLILCSCFVGTYFYKHCVHVRRAVIAERKGHLGLSRVGYSDLGVALGVATHQQNNNPTDQDYLEPVNSYKTDYDEIADHTTVETPG